VASVRLNEKWKFADPGYSLDSDDSYVPGQSLFVADGPLSTFIAFAYKLDLLHSMIANLPKWANEQSYEIRARVPGAPSKDQARLMMRALLVERFQLAIHFEKQEKPALALTLIKPGKLGPGLHRHDEGAGCKVSGTPPKPVLDLQNLSPDASYEVEIRTTYDKAPLKEMKGSELAHLQIPLPEAPSSTLIFYRQK
jgi:uncharacterized protein (TIGR03435 family)